LLISLIVAMASNRVIGMAGQLPWHLPGDLQRFKRLTMGHHLLMGRKTWNSIGRPLPGRTSLIVSRDPAFVAPGGQVFGQLTTALAAAEEAGETELFVCGGAEIYAQLLPVCHRIYLSRLSKEFRGDVYFPEMMTSEFRVIRHVELFAEMSWQFTLFARQSLSAVSTAII
jgi:dihydrofolate reductase